LIQNGNEFPYGQIADQVEIGNSWKDAKKKFELEKLEKEVAAFNKENKYFKKGISLMPISFGISFTKTVMNHARALVHIYQDGSIGVSTGAVEMGQGVNTKMLQVAASVFSVKADKIKLETTNTTRVANTSPTAASATADLNGKALEMACNALVLRLKECASKHLGITVSDIKLQDEFVFNKNAKTEWNLKKLIETAFLDRVCLSENGHYATPIIHYNKEIEKGHPFAYHVYGTAITVVTVDCIRGRYEIDALKIVHDFGKSMNTIIDRGQVEGAAVQGIGWMTMEEIIYNAKGKLISNALSTYKIPDIYSAPKELLIEQLETQGHDLAILKSKAVGEPPLMYGIGAYFAIQNAVKAFNPNYKLKFDAPFTPEKVLMGLYERL
jgi:xanthine dehydrogenase large subunit